MNLAEEDFFTEFNKRYQRVLVDSDGNPIVLPVVGDLIGKIRVERILGSGAMGVVYLGKEIDFDMLRAIKIAMPSSGNKDLARMRNEAKVCAKLEHPNIVRVYNAGYWKDLLPYAEMEYVEGTDLDKVIKEYKTVPVPFALSVLSILCCALEYAHSQVIVIGTETFSHLVHRDLKPANVLISAKGVVKLTDFGLVKFEKMTDASVSGLILGTVPYMAPEHQKYGQVSVESDIYAMGVMLYELLAGKRPFPDGNTLDLHSCIAMKENASFEPLDRTIGKVDPEIEKIINRCLRPAAKDRYDSYALLQFALHSTLERYTRARAEDIVSLFLNNHQNFKSIIGINPRRGKIRLPSRKVLMLGGAALGVMLLVLFIWWVLRNDQPLPSAGALDDTNAITEKTRFAVDSVHANAAIVNPRPEPVPAHPEQLPAPHPGAAVRTAKQEPLQSVKKDNPVVREPSQSGSSWATAQALFRKGDFDGAAETLRKLDFSVLQPAQRDSGVVLLLESLYKSDNFREAIRLARFYPVSDGKYFLLLAFCQESMGMYNEAEQSYNTAIAAPFVIDKSEKRNAFLLRARYYQHRYSELRVDQLGAQMVKAWQDFIDNECAAQSPECDEARRITGGK